MCILYIDFGVFWQNIPGIREIACIRYNDGMGKVHRRHKTLVRYTEFSLVGSRWPRAAAVAGACKGAGTQRGGGALSER